MTTSLKMKLIVAAIIIVIVAAVILVACGIISSLSFGSLLVCSSFVLSWNGNWCLYL